MKLWAEEEYDRFLCIGSDCSDTCCAGWSIYIDPASADLYDTIPGDFGQELRDKTEDQDGKRRFRMDESQRCPFLNQNNLCRIYRTLGEEKMCFSCQMFPRNLQSIGDICFASLSLACPEAARMLLCGEERPAFLFNDNVEGEETTHSTDYWISFNQYVRFFTTVSDISINKNLTLRARLLAILLFGHEMQEMIAQKEDPAELIRLFSDPDLFLPVLSEAEEFSVSSENKILFFSRYLHFLQDLGDTLLSHYYNAFLPLLNTSELPIIQDSTIEDESEKLLFRLLFRHIPQKFETGNLWSGVFEAMILFSVYRCFTSFFLLLNKRLPDRNERIAFIARNARHFEHNENNLQLFYDDLLENNMTELDFLTGLVL